MRNILEKLKASDMVSVLKGVVCRISDSIRHRSEWRIDRFNDPDGTIERLCRQGLSIEKLIEMFPKAYLGSSVFYGNVCLNEGIQAFEELLAGISNPTKWDATNARLGVGDSTAAENPNQTGLQGTNKTFKPMDAGYPTRSGQTLSWRATFGANDANYAWNEFTVVNAADDTGQNLNRKVSAQGTKQSGQTWVLTLSITWS